MLISCPLQGGGVCLRRVLGHTSSDDGPMGGVQVRDVLPETRARPPEDAPLSIGPSIGRFTTLPVQNQLEIFCSSATRVAPGAPCEKFVLQKKVSNPSFEAAAMLLGSTGARRESPAPQWRKGPLKASDTLRARIGPASQPTGRAQNKKVSNPHSEEVSLLPGPQGAPRATLKFWWGLPPPKP
jgi:hypothetical protein